MEKPQFDGLTRALAGVASRRGVLRGLVAGGTMVLLGTAPGAAKPGNGKAYGRNRVGLCHRSEDGTFTYKKLPAKAAAAHNRSHGDQLCPPDDQCNTYNSCDQTSGACASTISTEACTGVGEDEAEFTGSCVADANGVGVCTPPTV